MVTRSDEEGGRILGLAAKLVLLLVLILSSLHDLSVLLPRLFSLLPSRSHSRLFRSA